MFDEELTFSILYYTQILKYNLIRGHAVFIIDPLAPPIPNSLIKGAIGPRPDHDLAMPQEKLERKTLTLISHLHIPKPYKYITYE